MHFLVHPTKDQARQQSMFNKDGTRSSRYWAARATAAWTLAAEMSDRTARATMEQIAHAYERMARRSERKEKEARTAGAPDASTPRRH
jgi:hypothetical protein